MPTGTCSCAAPENRSLLELPVIACYYVSDSPNRLSDLERCDADQVRAKLTGTVNQFP
jgi:hypothetical protein